MDVNVHERLSNFTLQIQIKVKDYNFPVVLHFTFSQSAKGLE